VSRKSDKLLRTFELREILTVGSVNQSGIPTHRVKRNYVCLEVATFYNLQTYGSTHISTKAGVPSYRNVHTSL
jgi:hypothetical protein